MLEPRDIACFVLTLVVLAAAMALTPRRAQCPRGFWVNGVRPSGSFECLRDRDPSTDNEHSKGHDVLGGAVYCEPSFIPVATSDRDVACISQSTIP